MNTTNQKIVRSLQTLLVAIFLGGVSFTSTAQTIIDNTDPGFSATGTWPISTVVPGFFGPNYQTHAANGMPPGGIAVDNTDPGFSATGTWNVSTVVAGFFGPNYQTHAANGDAPSTIIVDNPDGVAVGTWPTSTNTSGFFGANYQFHATGTGANTFTWTPVIPSSDSYDVYARWTAHSNRASDAKYTVTHAAGTTQVVVNQKLNNGTWILLGTFTMDPGQGHNVSLTDDANGFVIADAVKVVPAGALPNTATWTPVVPAAGSYKVFARWTAHPNRATDAKYTVLHDGGTTLVTIDQQQNNGTWILLGTFNLTPGLGQGASLTDQANGFVIADAVMILDANAPEFNEATWTPGVAAGQYEVYARWTSHPNRASNATYTINHAQGTATILKDQQVAGGQFNLLGTFSLNGSSTIVLDDRADGFVIADAIQLIPVVPAQEMFFIHTDHLNTPRLIANSASQPVWQWNNDDPYGDNVPNEDPSGVGSFTCNLRLPGQYFDVESDTNYNYFRSYDTESGRYIQSDLIGLSGGLNTYGYVGGSPLRFIDPYGLFSISEFIVDAGNFRQGTFSYFRGVVRTGRFAARRAGLFGKCEQELSINEGIILSKITNQLTNSPGFRGQVTDAIKDFAANNKAYVAGRAGIGSLTSYGLSRAAGGLGIALGVLLPIAAINGDVRSAIESGATDAKSIAAAIAGGKIGDRSLQSQAGCRRCP